MVRAVGMAVPHAAAKPPAAEPSHSRGGAVKT